MKREKLYWLCQITGWSLYTAVSILIQVSFNTYPVSRLPIPVVICGIGFLLSHLFRLFIKRRGWLRLPLPSLIPRVIVACVSLALIWEIIAVTLLVSVFQIFTLAETRLGVALGTTFSWSATLLIWSMIYFGFHFIKDYRRTEIEKWRLEATLKEAELRALKSQMNPHFIFNCLNSIRALIVEDPERAQTVVTQLANMLRYSLKSQNTETVTLEEELQIVSDYLALETIRLEERLKISFSIDPATLSVPVPTMLVQTLVENGIKYGVATLPKGGEISLTSSLEDSKLRILVVNTGQLAASGDSTGLGLSNAVERLKLLFGDSASLKLESNAPDYVTANVEIPLRRNNHQ